MSDITSVALASLKTNYAAAGGNVDTTTTTGGGIWSTLLQIALQALQSFLSGGAGGLCPAPATPAAAINGGKSQAPGAHLFVRRHVATQLREDYGFGAYLRYNGDAMVSAILATAANSSEEQMAQLAALPAHTNG